MGTRKMGKREFIRILEEELRRQASQGQVSSKLAEQIVTVRGWRKKNAKGAVQPSPPPSEALESLPALIAAAKAEEPTASPQVPQPATGPAIQPSAPQGPVPASTPQPPPSAVPPHPPVRPETGWTLEHLKHLMPFLIEEKATPRPAPPAPVQVPVASPTPQPRSVYFASHLLNDDPEPERPAGYSDTYF